MCIFAKGNPLYNLIKLLPMEFRDKQKISLKGIKMNLQIIILVLCVWFEISLVQFASCSPVPESVRQKSVFKNEVQAVDKCPELTFCTCKERDNKGRKLDITCNGVNSNNLKVSFYIVLSREKYLIIQVLR